MKKKKKEKVVNKYKNDIKRLVLVFAMMVCIIVSMCTYWIYAYHQKRNYSNEKIISYKVSDYVSVEGNIVYLKNIDTEINADFVLRQKEILNDDVIDINIIKGLYNGILSIKISYILSGETSNYEEIITLNVNVREDMIISNDELLELADVTYKDIAMNLFEDYIKLPSDSTEMVVDAITEEKMSGNEFNKMSEKYIIRIREKLPDVMSMYIDNDRLYYIVRLSEINSVCYYTGDVSMINIDKEIGKI